VPEAAGFGEVVVFATPYNATQEAVGSAGNLNGKVVFDCTNPLKSDLSGLIIGFNSSAAEQVASWAKGGARSQSLQHHGRQQFGEFKLSRGRSRPVLLR
jgi:8-hydroxy-5-deazaflavin:NADPH oxidoreductase